MNFLRRFLKISATSAALALLVLMMAPKSSVLGQIGYQIVAATATITNDLTVGGQIFVASGDANDPGIAFTSDTDTGMYYAPVGINWAVAGTNYMALSPGQLAGPGGSVTAPGITFTADSNTGMYRANSDELSFTAGGKDLGRWLVATGTFTATEVRNLNATPVTVIAAPGAGLAIVVESAQFMLDWNSIAYDSVGAGEDVQVRYSNGAAALSTCDASANCFTPTATADAFAIVYGGDHSTGVAGSPLSNIAVLITVLNGEWASADNDANGDSPIHYLIRYRIVSTDLS